MGDPPSKRAEQLVGAAEIYAVHLLTSLLKRYPEIGSVLESDLMPYWDFLLTVACVGVAFVAISTDVPPAEQERVREIVKERLGSWQPCMPPVGMHHRGREALGNFLGQHVMFVKRGNNPPDAVGAWIWRNLEVDPQANEELKALARSLRLVRPVGVLPFAAFRGWWLESKPLPSSVFGETQE